MENPWKNITEKKGEYIAPCDEDAIHRLSDKRRSLLQLQYLPQPYMGDPEKAEIFLLNANPNADANGSHRKFNKEHREVIIDSLEHKLKDYPLYALNSNFEKFFIYKWWYEHLKCLIEETDIETVREKLFVAEYFPYFSNHFGDVQNIRVPSQKYTFHLIRKAMKDGKIIVIMRAETKWCEEIPELKTPNVITLKNPMAATVSCCNTQPGDFDKILTRLKKEKQLAGARQEQELLKDTCISLKQSKKSPTAPLQSPCSPTA